jgi:hypothetical protein
MSVAANAGAGGGLDHLLGGFGPGGVIDNNIRASLGKRQRHRFADAGTSASDKGFLSLEDFLDRIRRHHCRGQVFFEAMLAHEMSAEALSSGLERLGDSLISNVSFISHLVCWLRRT